MFDDGQSKYFTINVMARRARALNRGARPAIPYQEGASDPIQTAIDELVTGRLKARHKEPEKKS